MKIFKTHIVQVVGFIVTILIVAVGSVSAADFIVSCNTSSCTSSPLGQPIFTELNVVPGDISVREVRVCNNASESLIFALEETNFVDSSPSLGNVMDFSIKDVSSLDLVYGPISIAELDQKGYVLISSIGANTCKNYYFRVSFNNVGNEYQNKSLSFDFGFGFDAVPGITLTPTPVPGSVLGEQVTPTPIPGASAIQTKGLQTTSTDTGNVLAATGITLVVPLLAGAFLMLSGLLFFASRKKQKTSN